MSQQAAVVEQPIVFVVGMKFFLRSSGVPGKELMAGRSDIDAATLEDRKCGEEMTLRALRRSTITNKAGMKKTPSRVARPHQGIGQRVPIARLLKTRTDPASLIAVPVHYRAAA
jgi:hypothetical protein